MNAVDPMYYYGIHRNSRYSKQLDQDFMIINRNNLLNSHMGIIYFTAKLSTVLRPAKESGLNHRPIRINLYLSLENLRNTNHSRSKLLKNSYSSLIKQTSVNNRMTEACLPEHNSVQQLAVVVVLLGLIQQNRNQMKTSKKKKKEKPKINTAKCQKAIVLLILIYL